MEMKILQNFKGMIGKTEFNREDLYEVTCQLISDTDLSDALDEVSSDIADSFVSAVKKIFEISESCRFDIYDFLTILQGEIECRKNTLAEEIASFKWKGKKFRKQWNLKK